MLVFVIICGLLAVAYGIFTSRSILSASAGNERMQTIAGAIQEGAKAYLNRQYTTIGVVGIVVAVILYLLLGWQVAAGYLVGAILSGAAGYIGLKSGLRMKGKGFQDVPPGERMVVLTPGGGGIGAPAQRDRAQIARDVADGLISPETAREVYGYAPPEAAE